MLQDDDLAVDESIPDDEPSPSGGAHAPRQSYNFAPGYHGVVYRADTPDWGAGPGPGPGPDGAVPAPPPAQQPKKHRYKLQTMKWGLVPSWTKRNPDYRTLMRTINCRDDSLASPGGLWASMKGRKRCVVLAQGFYEWLKTGPREKQPHFVRRKDGRLMCFAGLWDCVRYEGSWCPQSCPDENKLYTYTVITTDSNAQLRFLHDRMPVILDPGSDAIRRWVDPGRHEWSRELQALLRPFEGELEVYPVSKEVGKVGNDSPSFVVPLDSRENRSNIANFFSKAGAGAGAGAGSEGGGGGGGGRAKGKDVDVVQEGTFVVEKEPWCRKGEGKEEGTEKEEKEEKEEKVSKKHEAKRKTPPTKSASPPPPKKAASERAKISATKNERRSPRRATRGSGSQKITKFFGNSA
ncbi:hypothetical protein E4U41_000167 [Claviceps citrina]|nr:hypothetical protein E4U41_000167 [Claviceps citrina]